MSFMRRTIILWFGLMLAAVVVSHDAAAHPVHEVQVVASKPGFDPSTIDITAGQPVRLVIRSKDVAHGFSVPKLNIDVHIPKNGEPVVVEFIAPPPGRFEIACSEFCGSGHGQMKAALISVAATPTAR